MRLLNIDTLQMEITYEREQYAILSHTWEGEEPTYQDFCSRPDEVLRSSKISGFIAAAKKRRARYVWIDTICIDKTSSSELQEAINSMFTWYAKASFCIAYLSDVTWEPYQTTHMGLARNLWSRFGNYDKYSPAIRIFLNSRWFTRGWTLQELIAPEIVHFYDSKWSCIIEKAPSYHRAIGDVYRLPEVAIKLISKAAGVPAFVLEAQGGYRKASMAQRMSWASSRQTTRIEDRAYSLMGLFDVHMPMLYGEGSAAFTRLREEIMKRSNDHSLLAYNFNWHDEQARFDNLPPADYTLSPANYGGCSYVTQWNDPNEDQEHFSMTNMGLLIKLKIVAMEGVPGMFLARLNCHQSRGVPRNSDSQADVEDFHEADEPNEAPGRLYHDDYSGYHEDFEYFEYEENNVVVVPDEPDEATDRLYDDDYSGYHEDFEYEEDNVAVEPDGPDEPTDRLYDVPNEAFDRLYYDEYSGYYEDFEDEETNVVVDNDDGEPCIIAIPLYQSQGQQRSNTFYRPISTLLLSLSSRLFETDAAMFKTIYIAEKPYSNPALDGILELGFQSFSLQVIETYPLSAIDPSHNSILIRHSSLEPPKVVYLQVIDMITLSRHIIRADITYHGDRYTMLIRICSHASFHSLMSSKGTGETVTPDSIYVYPSGTIIYGAIESGTPVVIRHEPAKIFINDLKWPEYKTSPMLSAMRCLFCDSDMWPFHHCYRLEKTRGFF